MFKLSDAFIYGFSRALDISGSMYREHDLSEGNKKDYEALRRDWERVGETIYKETNYYSTIKQTC